MCSTEPAKGHNSVCRVLSGILLYIFQGVPGNPIFPDDASEHKTQHPVGRVAQPGVIQEGSLHREMNTPLRRDWESISCQLDGNPAVGSRERLGSGDDRNLHCLLLLLGSA